MNTNNTVDIIKNANVNGLMFAGNQPALLSDSQRLVICSSALACACKIISFNLVFNVI